MDNNTKVSDTNISKTDIIKEKETDFIYVYCPHCESMCQIEQINCGIFRHGVYKSNNQPIPPHASIDMCKQLLDQNLIYGCGKPFKLISNIDKKYIAIECDYI